MVVWQLGSFREINCFCNISCAQYALLLHNSGLRYRYCSYVWASYWMNLEVSNLCVKTKLGHILASFVCYYYEIVLLRFLIDNFSLVYPFHSKFIQVYLCSLIGYIVLLLKPALEGKLKYHYYQIHDLVSTMFICCMCFIHRIMNQIVCCALCMEYSGKQLRFLFCLLFYHTDVAKSSKIQKSFSTVPKQCWVIDWYWVTKLK